MALWVQKYKPTNLEELTYHHDLSERLRKLALGEEFPHLFIYGPSGAGKKTRVMALLRELFGPSVLKIRIENRVVDAGTRKLEINVVFSSYHVEISPSEAGLQDRVVVQELLKEIAQTQQVDLNAKHKFKVVVINDADMLSRDAQAGLRRTMEIYSRNIRLILLATAPSSIMGPIKSRTLLVRVAAPQELDIVKALKHVAESENIVAPAELLKRIAQSSKRNLRKALLMLEALYVQSETLTKEMPIPLPDWEQLITTTAADVARTRTVQKLAEVRGINYDLLAHCIPAPTILKSLTFALLPLVSASAGREIVQYAAEYDHRIRLGSKAIFHLEAYVARVMRILEGQS